MKSREIVIENRSGDKLSAFLDMPLVGHAKAFAIFAHCFTCSKDLKPVENISGSLTAHGIAVLRFDFTGLGQSEGEFSESNFSTNLSDIADVYNFLKKNYQAPQLLIGHSLGGAAVLNIAGELAAIKAVATIGAPAKPAHVKHLLEASEDDISSKGVASVNIGGRPFIIRKQFLKDLEENSSLKKIESLGKAILIVHSPQDEIVDIKNAAEIFTLAKHPKSFISLDGANHLMTRSADSRYVGTVIASWSERYIDQSQDEVTPEGEVLASVGREKFLTNITAGNHHLIADEPVDVGGADLGPTPYGYLLSGLGSCTAMTIKMYADFKKIKLDQVKVYLSHDKIHIEDCENGESKIDRIVREIEFSGDITNDQRKRLIEIANKCPVHKTLESQPLIVTREKESP